MESIVNPFDGSSYANSAGVQAENNASSAGAAPANNNEPAPRPPNNPPGKMIENILLTICSKIFLNSGADVGAAVGGEDDDEMPRDWLDYTYLFFRMALLCMVVYFYSTLTRFAIVILSVTMMYL